MSKCLGRNVTVRHHSLTQLPGKQAQDKYNQSQEWNGVGDLVPILQVPLEAISLTLYFIHFIATICYVSRNSFKIMEQSHCVTGITIWWIQYHFFQQAVGFLHFFLLENNRNSTAWHTGGLHFVRHIGLIVRKIIEKIRKGHSKPSETKKGKN